MVFELLRWWYGQGWLQAIGQTNKRAKNIGQSFSVGQLLGTLFEPWRRIVTYGDRTLDAKMRAALDNLISRLVGFMVRIFVLLAAGILALAIFLGGIVESVLWPLIPIGIVYCLVRSVTG